MLAFREWMLRLLNVDIYGTRNELKIYNDIVYGLVNYDYKIDTVSYGR
jgi:hypothetical protein